MCELWTHREKERKTEKLSSFLKKKFVVQKHETKDVVKSEFKRAQSQQNENTAEYIV